MTKSGSNAFSWQRHLLVERAGDEFELLGLTMPSGPPGLSPNANQWATSHWVAGSGKNKTFFFVDHEELRFVLFCRDSDNVIIPTQAFATAVENNVAVLHPGEAAAYKTMLGLLTGAPGAASAVPLANSSDCNSLSLTGFNPRYPTMCSAI